jgi:hypothetical protein
MSVVRILIWNLADSKSSIAELQERLPELANEDFWIVNEPQERFGLVARADELPDLEPLRHLIGKEPDIAEEFDAVR